MKRGLVMGMSVVLTILVVAWVISCGGGGSSGGGGNISFGPAGQGIILEAGSPYSFIFTVTFVPEDFGGPYESIILNLEDNLGYVDFTPGASSAGLSVQPLSEVPITLTIWVAPADAASTVCTEGIQYGPYDITLDELSLPVSVSEEALAAGQSTLDIINVGAFAVCIEITSPIDAVTGMDGADFALCDESIANMAGSWVGTYYCTGNCPEGTPEEPLGVSLDITQDPSKPGYATYEDEVGAFYSGNICGFTFSFDGGLEGVYDESGHFVMDPGGFTATKTSYYRSLVDSCRGNCYDTLSRPVPD